MANNATSLTAYGAGWGIWLLLATLLAIFAIGTRDRARQHSSVLLFIATAVCACLIGSANWGKLDSGASALRWSLSAFFLVGSIAAWMTGRPHQAASAKAGQSQLAADVRLLLIAVAALPILCLSVYPSILILQGVDLVAPHHAFFAAIGNFASYTIPLLIVAAVFVGHATGQRSSGWALGASSICNLAVTIAYLFSVLGSRQILDQTHLIHLIQINAIALAVFALQWEAALAWDRRGHAASPIPQLLNAQIGLSLLASGVVLARAGLMLAVFVGSAGTSVIAAGHPFGWIALFLGLAAAWMRAPTVSSLRPGRVAVCLLALSSLVAASTAHANSSGWLSFHILMAGTILAAAATSGLSIILERAGRGSPEMVIGPAMTIPATEAAAIPLQYQPNDPAPVPRAASTGVDTRNPRWTLALSLIATLLALRAMVGDPQAPWWSVATIASVSLLWTSLACWLNSPRLLYVSAPLLNLATTIWYLRLPWPAVSASDVAAANISVLALSGLAALVLHLTYFMSPARDERPPFHRFASMAATVLILAMAASAVLSQLAGQLANGIGAIQAAALGTTILLVAATLWDAGAAMALPQLYLLGLATAAALFNRFAHSAQWFEVVASLALSAYVVLVGLLVSVRKQLLRSASRLAISIPSRPRNASSWIVPANLALAAAAIALAIHCDFTISELSIRLVTCTGALLQIVGLILATRGDRRLSAYQAVLCIGTVAMVAWGWAWLPPSHGNPIDRSVIVLAALIAAAGVGAIALLNLRKVGSPWAQALPTVLAVLGVAWGFNLVEILSLEVMARVHTGIVEAHPAAIFAVLFALLGAAAAAILPALRRDPDAHPRTPSRKEACVYLAELLLVLAFLHLKVSVPQLFGGVLSQYWPLLVVALAFVGVGLSELLRRRGMLAVSSPLFRTGIFLPLLPVIAFGAAPSRVDLSNLLFVIGVFYALLSATRRSFAFGLAAALAANGGLWSLLHRQPQLAFLVHPQLWLAPAAVSVLIAAQLNRDRLPQVQLRFIRYCSLMLVYVSSTADIFLNGVADHPWLPLVLAVLSVAGVMTGLLLRIRPFLFLGSAFLAMAVITMIYYASSNLHWTWLWYVAGIALGTAIIVTFALFEKKRAEILALVEGLKQWQ